jgi:hypothetical protein
LVSSLLWDVLKSRVFSHNLSNASFICGAVFAEQIVRFCLRRRFWVRVIEEVLDTEQNLLDGNGRPPGFFFVQNRQTDGAGRVHVRVEERRDEFACDSQRISPNRLTT